MRYYIVTAEKDGFDIGEFFTLTSAIDLSGSWCRVAEVTDMVDHLRRLTYIDSQAVSSGMRKMTMALGTG